MNRATLFFIFVSMIASPLAAASAALELTPAQAAKLKLATAEVEARDVRPQLELPASLRADPRKVFRVAPVIDGAVTEVLVVENSVVRAGEILARLRSGGFGQAQTEYLNALSRERLAAKEQERLDGLWREGIVAESRALAAASEYQQARAALAQSRRQLRLAGMDDTSIAALENAENGLAELSLVSPSAGVVVKSDLHAGQSLAAGETAFEIADLSTLWTEVRIPVAALSQVTRGSEAEIRVSAWPDRVFKGRLDSLGGEVEVDSQTLAGRVAVANPQGLLRPGMFAQTRLKADARRGLAVPAGAVFRVGEQSYVFRVAGERRYEPVAVIPGAAAEGWVTVSGEGLAAGMPVVSGGVADLKSHWQYQGAE